MGKYIKYYDTHSEYDVEKDLLDLPNVAWCELEEDVHYGPEPDYSKCYLTFTILEDGTLNFVKSGPNYSELSISCEILYSIDNGNSWSTLLEALNLSVGLKVLFKGNNSTYGIYSSYRQAYGYYRFNGTAKFKVSGNIMSLIGSDNFINTTTFSSCAFYGLFSESNVINAQDLILPSITLASDCYGQMFYRCASLITAPSILPAETLTSKCYISMFSRCTSLIFVPKFSATVLAQECCESMFSGCTSLTTAPELPATTLAYRCYSLMFSDCTSLTTAPELPATTLVNDCYSHMFNGCTSLITVLRLPATTLAESCYSYMFTGCTSLISTPLLPATTLATNCYQCMFLNCTSLTTVPELPATELTSHCYDYMFLNCANLNYIKAMFTTTPSPTYTSYWVYGVSSTGTFVKNSTATWNVTGDSGIPTGWTVQTADS